ncbi:MAG: amidohydrolase family protein [Bacteroidota bacterium]
MRIGDATTGTEILMTVTIDIHTHILPEHMPHWAQRFGYGDFIHLEHLNCQACMMKGDRVFRQIESNCYRAEDRFRDMEQTGVDKQVLSTIPVLFNYWAKPTDALQTAQFFNDHIAETVRTHPDRFIGLGTLPMQDTDLAIKEMQRCVKELGLAGVEIGTNVNGLNLSEDRFRPFFAEAEKLQCAVFIHPWEMMGEDQMQAYWLPWLVGMPAETTRAICSLIFGGVFESYPKLRVAFAHGGGSFPYTLGRIQHGFDARPDLVAKDNHIPPASYVGKFWVDSLVHDQKALSFLLDKVGPDAVCVGSDYPFPLGEQIPGALFDTTIFDEALIRKVRSENAMRWLFDPNG